VFAGTSTLNQFERIVEVLGIPTEQQEESLKSAFTKTMLESLSTDKAKTKQKSRDDQVAAWRGIYPNASDEALDLLCALMQFSPDDRITARAGLTHPYCMQFHDAESEIEARREVSVETAAPDATGTGSKMVKVADNQKKSTGFYRETLYHMIKKNKK